MIRTTPFHERTSALNETGLWEHWANHLVATRYQMSEKFEYFAIRNAAGLFDTSPLYKYRIHGPDAERFLAGVLARDVRGCPVGRAQYTLWCDDRGFVIEDGVLLHIAPRRIPPHRGRAEPGLLPGAHRATRCRHRGCLGGLGPARDPGTPVARSRDRRRAGGRAARLFRGHRNRSLAGVPVHLSRTGYTGDLGYEIWAPAASALAVWDAIWAAGSGTGLIPFGMTALYMARIEAGLVLLDVDFHSSRFAWTDAERTTPIELGLGWMFRDLAPNGQSGGDGRAFIGRDAIRREIEGRTSRWKLSGLVVDWRDYDRIYDAAGLVPPKDHIPIQDEYYIYDDGLNQLGYATSQMYSPMLQRHIALARVPLALAAPGSRVKLELAVSHRYEYFDAHVARLPLFNPPRRTA